MSGARSLRTSSATSSPSLSSLSSPYFYSFRTIGKAARQDYQRIFVVRCRFFPIARNREIGRRRPDDRFQIPVPVLFMSLYIKGETSMRGIADRYHVASDCTRFSGEESNYVFEQAVNSDSRRDEKCLFGTNHQ